MAKFFKVIMDIVVILFIAALLALFVPPILGINTVVAQPGVSTNMQIGTVAYGTTEPISTLVPGDTIISNTSDETFLYEIVDVDSETGSFSVLAYSDAEPTTLELRRTATKLMFYIPFLGYLLIAMHSTEGLIILGLGVALIIVLFIIAEILCRKAKAKRADDEEDEEETPDIKYFRDLAVGQSRPNKLDELGTISIPPVADLLQEQKEDIAMANTIALDEELETPELILEQVDKTDKGSESDLEIEVIKTEEAPAEEAPAEEAPAEEDSTEEAPAEEVPAEEAPVEETPVEETPIEAAPEKEAEPIEEIPEKAVADTAEFTDLGSALENVLENEQMNQTRHSAPQPAPVAEPSPQTPAEEIELAIPVRTLDELLKEAYANGEDPQVSKDAATGITFVDYSNCL